MPLPSHLTIPTPRPRPDRAPRRSGVNALTTESVRQTRLGVYELASVDAACKLLDITLSEFLRECAVKAARALVDGRPGVHPNSREYVEPAPGRQARDTR